jgi:protein Tob/BTG
MRDEVSVAVSFISRLIERSSPENEIRREQLEVFKSRLIELLCERFRNHWFPEKPTRGQAYRCIRLNKSDRKDPVIDLAASQCGLTYEQLHLPTELTIWVDPKDVECRYVRLLSKSKLN